MNQACLMLKLEKTVASHKKTYNYPNEYITGNSPYLLSKTGV